MFKNFERFEKGWRFVIIKNFERFCILTRSSKTLNDFRVSRTIFLSFLSQLKAVFLPRVESDGIEKLVYNYFIARKGLIILIKQFVWQGQVITDKFSLYLCFRSRKTFSTLVARVYCQIWYKDCKNWKRLIKHSL